MFLMNLLYLLTKIHIRYYFLAECPFLMHSSISPFPILMHQYASATMVAIPPPHPLFLNFFCSLLLSLTLPFSFSSPFSTHVYPPFTLYVCFCPFSLYCTYTAMPTALYNITCDSSMSALISRWIHSSCTVMLKENQRISKVKTHCYNSIVNLW